MWTIVYNGLEKSFKDWGIGKMSRRDQSQAADEVSFIADGTAFDSTAIFPYGVWLSIYRDRTGSGTAYSGGNRWFYGMVVKTPRSGTAQAETLTYELVGPWYCLENRDFEQDWWMWNGTTNVNVKNGHIFLNLNMTAGVLGYATTTQQITEALQHSIDAGDPIQLGALPSGIIIPIDEVRCLKIAEVVRKELRWHPDAVTWFDYATVTPTLHIAQRPALQAATFNISTKPLSAVNIDRRDDLVLDAVMLKYEILSETDGVQHLQILTDYFPAESTTLGVLKATIDLRGFTSSYVTGDIECAEIDVSSLAWWRSHFAYLAEDNSRLLSLELVSAGDRPAGAEDYPSELTRGQLAEWMEYGGRQEKLMAIVTIESQDPTTGAKEKRTQNINLDITATDAPAGTHHLTTLTSYTEGDPVPVGLAEAFYNALKDVQYSGTVELTETEVDTALRAQGITDRTGVGLVLNLTGATAAGGTEWATMRATVQEAAYDVDTGRTVFTFGPPRHLGVDDMIELLMVTRHRQIYTNPAARGGTLSGGSQIQLGKDVGATNTDGGAVSPGYQKIAQSTESYIEHDPVGDDPAAPVARIYVKHGNEIIDLKTSDCSAAWDRFARTIQIRELDYCANGVLMKILVPCSESYAAPPPA